MHVRMCGHRCGHASLPHRCPQKGNDAALHCIGVNAHYIAATLNLMSFSVYHQILSSSPDMSISVSRDELASLFICKSRPRSDFHPERDRLKMAPMCVLRLISFNYLTHNPLFPVCTHGHAESPMSFTSLEGLLRSAAPLAWHVSEYVHPAIRHL